MHMPPNPFRARAKKIRMERPEELNDKGVLVSPVRLVLTVIVVQRRCAHVLPGLLAPYAIRMQERAKEALRRDDFMLFLRGSAYKLYSTFLLSVLGNQCSSNLPSRRNLRGPYLSMIMPRGSVMALRRKEPMVNARFSISSCSLQMGQPFIRRNSSSSDGLVVLFSLSDAFCPVLLPGGWERKETSTVRSMKISGPQICVGK